MRLPMEPWTGVYVIGDFTVTVTWRVVESTPMMVGLTLAGRRTIRKADLASLPLRELEKKSYQDLQRTDNWQDWHYLGAEANLGNGVWGRPYSVVPNDVLLPRPRSAQIERVGIR